MGDIVGGRRLDPRPPSEPPTTPRTPRTSLQSSLCLQVSVDESSCPVDESSCPADSQITAHSVVPAAAAHTQPQKRSPPTAVNDDASHDREDRSTSKRMRGANVEVY